MRPSKNTQCYCCEQAATTRDHIPPQCFFHKQKHLPSNSPNYRSNPIVVPSCPDHNNARSKDDEYAAAIITMNSESKLASTIFKSKWVQALLRHEGALGGRIFSTARKANVVDRRNGVLIPYETLAISYEVERVYRVIESAARALYYVESGYQEKWLNACIVKSPNFLNRDLSPSQDANELERFNRAFIYGEQHQNIGIPKKGAHPDVFYYQFFNRNSTAPIIRMVFYGDFTFLAFLAKEEAIYRSPIILL
jgi:hypothetical protein